VQANGQLERPVRVRAARVGVPSMANMMRQSGSQSVASDQRWCSSGYGGDEFTTLL